jgi:CRP/FNR family transcriptional regulator, cyclic AMP receptor protein
MTAPTTEELAAIPLLASLSPEELQAAAQLFVVRSYAKNTIVATEGDRLDLFNLILSGNVQAFWRDEAGHQLKLGIDGPGDHFADVTLGGEPALVSHIATVDLRVASIHMTDLKQLLRRHPQVAVVLLMELVTRLRRIIQRTKTLTMEDVYGRVVKVLLALAVEKDGELVTERLTHEDIGQRVGATREMVGRVLRDLARGGYVKTERGRMIVLRKPPSRW